MPQIIPRESLIRLYIHPHDCYSYDGGLPMSRRDIRKREPKKQKKDSRKPSTPISLRPSSPEVEVVSKRKRNKEPEE
jgi:hypothetical protein